MGKTSCIILELEFLLWLFLRCSSLYLIFSNLTIQCLNIFCVYILCLVFPLNFLALHNVNFCLICHILAIISSNVISNPTSYFLLRIQLYIHIWDCLIWMRGQQIYFVKGKILNTLGFAGSIVSVPAILPCG